MTESLHTTEEQSLDTQSVADIESVFKDLLKSEPKLIGDFVGLDAKAERERFLAGETVNPDNEYNKLANLNFDELRASIRQRTDEIIAREDLNPKFASTYEKFAEDYLKKVDLMDLAHQLKTTDDADERAKISERFTQINIELYGEPELETYRGLLAQKLQAIREKDLGPRAESIRSALMTMVPAGIYEQTNPPFAPSKETVDWVHSLLVGEEGDPDDQGLFGNLLRHVPDDDPSRKFSPEDIKSIFDTILREEFGEAAEGWRVDIEEATSITVKASEKRIVIPPGRVPADIATMKGLVVHELGDHFLRSVTGWETDLLPMGVGMPTYYDPEEGLGKTFEQALKGEYEAAGIPLYLVAGAMHHDKMDFRDTFEMMWRINLLSELKDGEDVTDEKVESKRGSAYNIVNRISRGTDELPWFKDLAYYKGSVEIWKYLEENRGDVEAFLRLTAMGRTNPFDKNQMRLVYETSTRP